MARKFWKITAYIPYSTPVATTYYASCDNNEEKIHNYAAEFLMDTLNEWFDEDCGLLEEEVLEESGYTLKEITYEQYREECGY